MITYSQVIQQRGKIVSEYPEFSLKRKQRSWINYPCAGKVLNFGSGPTFSPFHKELSGIYHDIESCDNDPLALATYKNIEEITGSFDLIIAEHVLEHIEIDYVINFLANKLYTLLNNSGTLILTVPNIHNFGAYFTDFDHKNTMPPHDLAAIMCCTGLKLKDFYKWSKQKHMIAQESMNELEKFIESFLERHYGLQPDRYITIVFEKNGKI
jgi:predicted SAM-dependent methyltransferase